MYHLNVTPDKQTSPHGCLVVSETDQQRSHVKERVNGTPNQNGGTSTSSKPRYIQYDYFFQFIVA